MTDAEHKEGDTWTNVYNGKVYRWNAERKLWVWTGETIPVPLLGEFP